MPNWEIESIGRLVIRPARKAKDGSLAKSEAKLAAALDASGFKSVAQAHDSGLRRWKAEERRRDAQAALKGIAPEGIDAIREQIALLPEPEEERDDLPTVEEAQGAETDAKAALTTKSELLEGCRAKLADALTKAARAAAAR